MCIRDSPGTVTSKLSDPFKNKNKNYFSPETSADYLYNVIETKLRMIAGKFLIGIIKKYYHNFALEYFHLLNISSKNLQNN